MSLKDMADRLNISEAQVSRIELDRRAVTPDMALRISRATDGVVLIADLIPEVFDAVRDEIERSPSRDGAPA